MYISRCLNKCITHCKNAVVIQRNFIKYFHFLCFDIEFSLFGACAYCLNISVSTLFRCLQGHIIVKKRKYLKDCPLFTCIHMFFMSPIIVWILGFDHIWYYEQRIIANLCIIDLEDYRSECNHVKCTGIWEDTHLVLTVFFLNYLFLEKVSEFFIWFIFTKSLYIWTNC